MKELNEDEETVINQIVHNPGKGIGPFILDIQALLVLVLIVGFGAYKNDITIILAGTAINVILQIYLINFRVKSYPILKSAIKKLIKKEKT